MKRRVHLVQVNHLYGNQAFLPYSVALLQSYAQTDPIIREHYDFAGFTFIRAPIEEEVKRIGKVDVLGASAYIWNFNYTRALCKAVKGANSDCLIVLGGPHVPYEAHAAAWFLEDNPYVDILIHHEGEHAFKDVLHERLEHFDDPSDYRWIPGLTVNMGGQAIRTKQRDRIADLDAIPSPYLTGVFDELVKLPYKWHPTQEVDRGCPYSCTFCDWGSSVFTKVRRFSHERLLAELDWFAAHKIDMVYNASANYGMTDKDVELTREMVVRKERTGYPNKFRAAYAKNSGDRVFEIARMLNQAGMCKGVTLSFQSMDEGTLTLVKRKNIKMDNFRQLMQRYRAENIPTYSEIIIGLPGESYESFADGLDKLVDCGAHDSLAVYTCECLPNSELSRPTYREVHGIKTVHSPVPFYHAVPGTDPHAEEYELVVETKTLNKEDWLKCQLLAWAVQAFHCLGPTRELAAYARHAYGVSYRQFYEGLLALGYKHPHTLLGKLVLEAEAYYWTVRNGHKLRDLVDPDFGNIAWPPEEWACLRASRDADYFYEALLRWGLPITGSTTLNLPPCLVRYQKAVTAAPLTGEWTVDCDRPLHEFLQECYADKQPEAPQPERRVYKITPVRKYGTLEEFAREGVWYNRKGGGKKVEVSVV